MPKDYDVAVLDGPGDTDYARYMKTDVLLSLQRTPDEWIHPDELLFQTVHQSSELWLKLAGAESERAATAIDLDELDEAVALLARASRCLRSVTEQLDIMRTLSPADFQTIRTVLGHGSGFESPGWRQLRETGKALVRAFAGHRERHAVDMLAVYTSGRSTPVLRCAEALVEWDEQIALWRTNHYKMLTRVIGYGVLGTKGTQSDTLVRLIDHRVFADLWELRTQIAAVGPMGTGIDG
ncbi:tryptophan 2,3-dioxygenase family protein [Cellulomonas sp.]|uniref:tryptophan 2,3-dioxygenase family protein n=1 Tax=Cellulomonas sp. TaxID=40001 RepID=UPI00281237CF|nr:tryptophan 2,3-dioxygenase family protein [Cellulomonas sp.]